MIEHESISNIPYLDGLNDSEYKLDLGDILTVDVSKNKVFDDIESFNDYVQNYLLYRNTVNSEDVNDLDMQLILALKSNRAMVSRTMEEKNEQYKEIYNLIESLKRDEKYKTIITEIITGNDENYGGEMQNVNDEYQTLSVDLANKKRLLEINLYTEEKLKKQNAVLRNVFIFLIVILFISVFKSTGLFSDNLYATLVGVIFALMVIYIVYEAFDIYMRDSIDFNVYKFIGESPGSKYRTAKKGKVDLPIHLQSDLPEYCAIQDNDNKSLTLTETEVPPPV